MSTVKGQHFPELAFPKVTATILFFYTPNPEYFPSNEFGSAEKLESKINQVKINLNRLAEEFPKLKILVLDISQERQWVARLQIYEIPTIIIFDYKGYEIRRWLPDDYERGGGSTREMRKVIKSIEVNKKSDK